MCHLLPTSAFLRWSALRFRHYEGLQFRQLMLPCAFALFSHHVAAKPSPNRASRGIFVEALGKFPGGGVSRFRTFKSRSNAYVRSRGESYDADSDDEEEEDDGRVYEAGEDYIVVNFYHFVDIENAHGEVAMHAAFIEGRNIRGRIYINHQGINAQFSGPREDAMAYADWVKADERFSPTYIQVSPSPRGHAFPRLKLRYKPSLVQVCEIENLPLTDPSARAVPLTPKAWREKLETRCQSEAKDELSNVKKVLLLDVRNRYEWDVGHFQGAQRPEVECFKSTEFGLSDEKVDDDPLAGVDKENTDVMMYCTGGIRCDVYSTILRYTPRVAYNQPLPKAFRCSFELFCLEDDSLYGRGLAHRKKGFKNLYSLRGGVAKYLKDEGASQWNGRLFVFDSRLAVPPAFYHGESEDTQSDSSNSTTVARCVTCGSAVEPVHRNCANLDCNNLYLSCGLCVTQFRGCCCDQCMNAPRLRPILRPDETYQRWHNYRDPPPPPPRPPGWVSRRALKRRRRKERRKEAELLNSGTGVPDSTGSDSPEEASSLVHQL